MGRHDGGVICIEAVNLRNCKVACKKEKKRKTRKFYGRNFLRLACLTSACAYCSLQVRADPTLNPRALSSDGL